MDVSRGLSKDRDGTKIRRVVYNRKQCSAENLDSKLAQNEKVERYIPNNCLTFKNALTEARNVPGWDTFGGILDRYHENARSAINEKAEYCITLSLTLPLWEWLEQIIRYQTCWHHANNRFVNSALHLFVKQRSVFGKVTRLINRNKTVEICYLDFSKDLESVFTSYLIMNHQLLVRLDQPCYGKGRFTVTLASEAWWAPRNPEQRLSQTRYLSALCLEVFTSFNLWLTFAGNG